MIAALDLFLEHHFSARGKAHELVQAMKYSLHSGGKRFRPQVAFLTAQLLEVSPERVLAHAAAVELVHTYSLIHDDLPCMDNDTFRRGKFTNHIMFGESTALLAGDALLTEAFAVLAENYSHLPELGLELTRLLSEAAGYKGMIGGQVEDLEFARQQEVDRASEKILEMHEKKTGALIRYAAEGVAVLARIPKAEQIKIREFGAKLGLAFQIADDLLDYDPKRVEKNGLPFVLGVKMSRELLQSVSSECKTLLKQYGERAKGLLDIVEKNCLRDR